MLPTVSCISIALLIILASQCKVIVDINESAFANLKAGKFPFLEHGGAELLARVNAEFPERLVYTTDYMAVRDCSEIIVAGQAQPNRCVFCWDDCRVGCQAL